MNNKINAIKNLVYEAEGLLELLQLRQDKLTELAPLILARLDESRSEMAELAPKANEMASGKTDSSLSNGRHQDQEVEFKQDFAEDEAEMNRLVDNPIGTDLISHTEQEIPSEELEVELEEVEPKAAVVKGNQTAKPAFTLNDKFRFRRTLFGGSDAQFKAAMDHVASMDSYEEAEEYFIEDLGFDAENEDVQAFMEIINEYFGR